MSLFAILLGGELTVTPRLTAQLDGARVIAADSGMRHAARLGIMPELWVGDFDSADARLQDRFSTVPRQAYPSDKAMTDGELAIAAASKAGADRLLLVGAFGGARADHGFLHLTAAMSVSETGMGVTLTSGVQEGHPLHHGDNPFDFASGTQFSVLAFSDLSGLTITGAKWPLDAIELAFGSSLTLSNEVRGALSVSLASGRAMLLAHLPQES